MQCLKLKPYVGLTSMRYVARVEMYSNSMYKSKSTNVKQILALSETRVKTYHHCEYLM